jgi:hypothetical protein
VQLTAAHWVYLAGVVVILVIMVFRKNIVVPAVAATFLTAWVFSGSLVTGLASVFNASLVAATELFNIFLIIALVTAMLGALREMGADRRMVTPFRGVMRNGHLAFWTLAVVTYVISLFFWPTPAVPLIGAVLVPVAIRAGLPAMGVGMVIAIAGQGMALSSDYIIRVAPGLSATAAGADADVVADRAFVLSLIVGVPALIISYIIEFRRMRRPAPELLTAWENTENVAALADDRAVVQADDTAREQDGAGDKGAAETAPGSARTAVLERERTGTEAQVPEHDGPSDDEPEHGGRADRSGYGEPTIGHGPALRGTPAADPTATDFLPKAPNPRLATTFAVIVPLAYLALVVYMLVSKISDAVPDLRGGDAAALVGGIAALLLFLATLAQDRRTFLDESASHVVDGLVFAFKAMGIVLPIAGFFFLGNPDFSGAILGLPEDAQGPSLLFDLVQAGQHQIPQASWITAFVLLIIGMIAGLEGSGFSGLPLTGSLAGSLGPAVGMDPATLAAIGQMGNIWSGGGTLVAWSSLIAVAGFARVPVIELARRCFVPVVTGLVLATIFAVIFY